MSHVVYQTDAFVIGSAERGEGSRTIYLFTKEFGLITALAQSVRETRSKLRHHLQPYSHAEVTLVRGRETWRIVGAGGGKLNKNIFDDRGKRNMIAKIFSLIKRLVPREDNDARIYEDVCRAIGFLDRENVSKEELAGMEILVVLRVLRILGYLRDDERFAPLIASENWDPVLLASAYDSRDFAVSAINNSLRESQL
jgi:DNA repair protein RecO